MTCDSEGILEGSPLFTNTDIASDWRTTSPLTGLPWFDDIIWIINCISFSELTRFIKAGYTFYRASLFPCNINSYLTSSRL